LAEAAEASGISLGDGVSGAGVVAAALPSCAAAAGSA
jgi:hypothetical protein